MRYTTETFVKESLKIHKCKYSYDESIYKNSKTKVIIICQEHGRFLQSPEKHLIGQGCPNCSKESLKSAIIKRNKSKKVNIDKDTLTRKYLDEELTQREISLQMDIPESTISTYINRYGLNKDENKISDTRKKTNIKKYGAATPAQNISVVNKMVKTNIEKYGEKYPTLNNEVRERIINGRVKSGNIIEIFGKTISCWSDEYDCPRSYIYYIYNKDLNTNKVNFVNIVKNYRENITNIEQIISNEIGIQKWNSKFSSSLNYRPDFKLTEKVALNVDGLYWHSELNKNNKYHFNMRKDYENLGLRIFQFREDEIYQKLEIIKSMINNSMGKIIHRIGARKTTIKIVDSSQAKIFLRKNHLKGYKYANHYGLFLGEELVSIMSYKVFGKENIMKIERFCSKAGMSVIGGFSKLLNAIGKDYPNYNIHYWVDLRYGTGNFLLSQDFKKVKETLGWEWTDGKNTYNRLKCRANMDERKLSQKKHAEELGWYKIYDAGQRLYVKNQK